MTSTAVICEILAHVWNGFNNNTLSFEVSEFKAVKKGMVPGALVTAAAHHEGLVKLTEKGEKNLGYAWALFLKDNFEPTEKTFSSKEEFLEWAVSNVKGSN